MASMVEGGGVNIGRFSRHGLLAAIAALLLAASACGHSEEKAVAVPKGDTREQLAIGYAILYGHADGIPKFKWLLMLKKESDEFNEVRSHVIAYYEDLAKTLERLSNEYPAVKIHTKPMATIEEETRKAIGADQAKDIMPIAGKGGVDFERQALLMFYNALDEQRHLVGVMIDMEPNKNLNEFLQKTKAQLESRHAKVGALLDKRYFTH